jgi:hypothetical protein
LFQSWPDLKPNCLPKQPLDAISLDGGTVPARQKYAVFELIIRQIYQRAECAGISLAESEEVRNFDPALQAETSGKAIIFSAQLLPSVVFCPWRGDGSIPGDRPWSACAGETRGR